ncbi:crotonase/enoyl-CoA hydratase family protein [Gemmobacter fulvus]|uniref:Crotonase/enoyl-CoA hydratase family protein n=1 Tax=Gemmobacter fulvus TaxID=2840474 RepID=A0A975P7R1_9RHOB|nr:crotonase/enoyl-CoA hydratase family protein [Gemmobacter fulvus]MBT9243991.1 crotonase/enoyl-CoA hydratase family protein [Gemmobacter fulvus]QWK90902.1 crotonase/enoyl-CoA hydratase family protein [Gemmobacter fulvus]
MYDTLLLELDARGVARLTLNRPEKHNTLSARMIEELTAVAARLGADPAVRVVVLAASGESFCAGGDLTWMKAQIAGDAATRRQGATALAMMLNALNTMPKPLIGRVQGAAYGGGVGMMSVCDLCIGTEGPKFGLTETKLGLIPATISPYVVARIGATAARRHFMASRLFDATEAHRIGLLSQIVPAADLDAAVEAEVLPFLGCAPGAVGDAKALVARLAPPIDRALIDDTIDRLVARWDSAEAAEGIAAFLEKRRPDWTR